MSMSDESPMAFHPVYHDYADKDMQWVFRCLQSDQELVRRLKIGPIDLFPVKLHAMLEVCTASPTLSTIIRWLPHGRAFKLYDKQRFLNEALPQFFQGNSTYASFQRQLNMYCYLKLTGDHADKGAYYHPLMLQGRPVLSKLHLRQHETEKTRVRRRLDPLTEPDFYDMTPLRAQTSLRNIDDLASIVSFHGSKFKEIEPQSRTANLSGSSDGNTKALRYHMSGCGISSPQVCYWSTIETVDNSEYASLGNTSCHNDLFTREVSLLLLKQEATTTIVPVPAANKVLMGADATMSLPVVGMKRHLLAQPRKQWHRHDLNELAWDGTQESKWSPKVENQTTPMYGHAPYGSSFRSTSHQANLSKEQPLVEFGINVAPGNFEPDERTKRPRLEVNQTSTRVRQDKESPVGTCEQCTRTVTKTVVCDFHEFEPQLFADHLSFKSGDLSYDCGSEMTDPD